jgi:hypothetical protein
MSVHGFTDAITATTGDTITIEAGTGETISGSGLAVHGGSGTGFEIMGTGDVVHAGLNDAITDSDASTKFKIGSNGGNLAISGFGADTTGIVDLLEGVGGYTCPLAGISVTLRGGAHWAGAAPPDGMAGRHPGSVHRPRPPARPPVHRPRPPVHRPGPGHNRSGPQWPPANRPAAAASGSNQTLGFPPGDVARDGWPNGRNGREAGRTNGGNGLDSERTS